MKPLEQKALAVMIPQRPAAAVMPERPTSLPHNVASVQHDVSATKTATQEGSFTPRRSQRLLLTQ